MAMSEPVKEPSHWSVRVRVESPNLDPMVYFNAFRRVGMRGGRVASLGLEEGPLSSASAVTIDLPAADAVTARVTVLDVLGRVAPGIEVSILWVAPLGPDLESSHRFLEQAQELFHTEQYELAVVAAQIHLETHISTLLRRFVEADSSHVGRSLAETRTEWTFAQAWQRDLFEKLLGLRLSTAFDGWKHYTNHLEVRNAVAHRGQTVDQQAARESLKVVEEFWIWINDAALTAL